MLTPYMFVQDIKQGEFEVDRAAKAALALNLYYRDEDRPFDVSWLIALTECERVTCMAAIAWVCSHSNFAGEPNFPRIEADFLDNDNVRLWLHEVAAGRVPLVGGP